MIFFFYIKNFDATSARKIEAPKRVSTCQAMYLSNDSMKD